MAEEVVQEILWTPTALKSFKKILDYLERNWTEREIRNFINEVVGLLSNLKRQPEMCRASLKRRNVRIGTVNKHTQIVYHYQPRKRQIVVLLFWNQKQDPTRFKY
jgi:plasmid stabilization system protein ParE